MTSSNDRGPHGQDRDWRLATASDLIDHLRSHFHEAHRRQLPELVRLARQVQAEHGISASAPYGLAEHLEALQLDLESHMQKEEQVLFPMLRAGLRPPAPISVMRSEHARHAHALVRMAELAGGLPAPARAGDDWRDLSARLLEFHESLTLHIHLEDDVLFAGLAGGNG